MISSQDENNNSLQQLKSQSLIRVQKKINLFKLIIGLLIILVTSFQVYTTSVNTFNHSRQIIRSLNYYILQHTDFDIYWAGQTLLNYPINQYFLLQNLNLFLSRLQYNLANLQSLFYANLNQQTINSTTQTLYILRKDGSVDSYDWTIQQGINQPFQTDDLQSIKQTLLNCQSIKIPIHTIDLFQHPWNLNFQIQPYSQASTIVQIFAQQDISLMSQHIITSILGIILLAYLIYHDQLIIQYYDLPDYLLGGLLVFTGCLSVTQFPSQTLLILDGLTCFFSYLWILKFYTREDDYHISILIRKSYIFVGRLFISFGPVFIAFGLMGYTCFSRYSGQFESLWRTFLSLFYISYYNMTYESMIVTARINPLSVIFFVTFVILFTICVYSAMLVSIFCSYVWGKRQQKIKKDILQNLNIKCSSCNYKYRYLDSVKHVDHIKQLSCIPNTNFVSSQQAFKYKKITMLKIDSFCEKIENLQQNINLIHKQILKTEGVQMKVNNIVRQQYWLINQKVKKVMKQLDYLEIYQKQMQK